MLVWLVWILAAGRSALRRHRISAVIAGTLYLQRLFEIALVLVRLDHVASRIVNANHSVI